MTEQGRIPPFDWFSNQFSPEAREGLEGELGLVLKSAFRPGDQVLDLCCGAGAIAFFLEAQGASVTAIDQAPALISLAREEAGKRRSRVAFVQGDVLEEDLGRERYDLAVCLGNAVLDFPQGSFAGVRDRIWRALKPGARFVLEYHDGVLRLLAMREPAVVVEEGAAGQIERRFLEYDPERGAYRAAYRHLRTGEVCEYTGYLYTGPLLRCLLEPKFTLERTSRLNRWSFLDVFRRITGGLDRQRADVPR